MRCANVKVARAILILLDLRSIWFAFSLLSLSFSGLGDQFADLSSYFASRLRCFSIRIRIAQIKKSQMQVLDSLFWLLFSVSFVILGVFPQVAMWLSSLFGFMSASNFVFLYVIAVLVVRDFVTLFVSLDKKSD